MARSITSSGFSGSGSFCTLARIDEPQCGRTGTISATGVNGYAFGGSGSTTTR